MRVLVTGALGSVGRALCPKLQELGHEVIATDIVLSRENRYRLDVTDLWDVRNAVSQHQPHLIVHLAGFKQAPEGEEDPLEVSRVNINGTANVVSTGVRVILASTCKAADPETAYGATKLIAERIVLNAGGTVARFYNVREAGGNVFEKWGALPLDEPIPYTPCHRYFISMKQAIQLVVKCLSLPSGRYTVNPGNSRFMGEEAYDRYPDREHVQVPKRRGDRDREPLRAACEEAQGLDYDTQFIKIVSPHDA